MRSRPGQARTFFAIAAGDTVRTVTFYDNDSGGEKDARIEFVTPQSGNYFLLVGDNPDSVTGCYRYEVAIR